MQELEPAEIARRIERLHERRDRRIGNLTAEIDLPLGELMAALDAAYVRIHGKRKKRGSNAPTKAQFIQEHAGKDPSWARKCLKAYLTVRSDDWDSIGWDGRSGIEGINKAAREWQQAGKPHKARRNKWHDVLREMSTAIDRHDWSLAQRVLQAFCNLAHYQRDDDLHKEAA